MEGNHKEQALGGLNTTQGSAIEGNKFDLTSLAVGKRLEVNTQSGSIYIIEKRDDGLYISGNKTYCPESVKVDYIGSGTKEYSILHNIILKGLKLVFSNPLPNHKEDEKDVVTTHIKSFRILPSTEK